VRSGQSGSKRAKAVGGLGQQAGRGLAAYLLVPRPDTWAKALMAPACFLLAATSTGHFGGWARFVVLWLVLELLIYPARYQWNDIAGLEADQRHPENAARQRLPAGPGPGGRRRAVRLSGLTAAARVLAALLIGLAAGLAGQVLVMAGAVFTIAGSYEWLRSTRSGSPKGWRAAAVWVAVGLGYLVRGGLGMETGGLPWGSAAMAAGLACVTAFGIMFVLLTWALEVTSYCAADAGGGWHARADLAAKPHLAALLRHLGRPVLPGSLPPGEGRYCGADRVLRGGSALAAPWNLALLAAAASGGAEGAALARPGADGAAACLAAAGAGLAGGLLLARCRTARGRWAVTAAWFGVTAGAGLLGRPALPLMAGLPWLAIAALYAAFTGWSYRDLIAASPQSR
jgi:4-hydroxybenzoate polyprenyltransferase